MGNEAASKNVLTGIIFALIAGLMWGTVFVVPLMLPEYPPSLLAVGRYLAFGLIALPLSWMDRKRLREFKSEDWWQATKLSLVGNFFYYACLAAAIQRCGAPLPTVMVGTLPIIITTVSNLRDGDVPWLRLLLPLALIGIGIFCVNFTQFRGLSDSGLDPDQYAIGALFGLLAVVAWTWYPIRNADWLRRNCNQSSRAWASAQGLVTLPIALVGMACLTQIPSLQRAGFSMPLGPTPGLYLILMIVMGLLASWVGTMCWNAASKRLPTSLAGQLIVFETLAALLYAFVWYEKIPEILTLFGILLITGGVVRGVRVTGNVRRSE